MNILHPQLAGISKCLKTNFTKGTKIAVCIWCIKQNKKKQFEHCWLRNILQLTCVRNTSKIKNVFSYIAEIVQHPSAPQGGQLAKNSSWAL